MKSRLTISMLAALFLGACTSGSQVTGYYADDIYFNPGSVPPPISVDNQSADKSQGQTNLATGWSLAIFVRTKKVPRL
jgi:hypothetical protein